ALEGLAMIKFLATLLASAALSTSLPLQARSELDVVSLKSAIERLIESDYPKLEALYKDIHAHPEIAFQERAPSLMMADEMVHCNPEVTRAVFHLMRCLKQWADIDGGHFGLLYYPSEIFDQASTEQCAFLVEALGA